MLQETEYLCVCLEVAALYLAAVVIWHVICLLDLKLPGCKEASDVSAQLFSVFVCSAESVLIREAFQSFPEMPRQGGSSISV